LKHGSQTEQYYRKDKVPTYISLNHFRLLLYLFIRLLRVSDDALEEKYFETPTGNGNDCRAPFTIIFTTSLYTQEESSPEIRQEEADTIPNLYILIHKEVPARTTLLNKMKRLLPHIDANLV